MTEAGSRQSSAGLLHPENMANARSACRPLLLPKIRRIVQIFALYCVHKGGTAGIRFLNPH